MSTQVTGLGHRRRSASSAASSSAAMSDKVFGSRRAPVVVIGFARHGRPASGCSTAPTHWPSAPGAPSACLSLLSFFVNGAHGMIGGAASMDFGGRKGVATAAGLFDGMQYLAAAVHRPRRSAAITTDYGWQAWKLWADALRRRSAPS
ncbi:MAG: hypothetical protein MZV70_00285 [Desulfobacterales bacterium]|nr:hypothetical protein [Desulfobacterales bacterium]